MYSVDSGNKSTAPLVCRMDTEMGHSPEPRPQTPPHPAPRPSLPVARPAARRRGRAGRAGLSGARQQGGGQAGTALGSMALARARARAPAETSAESGAAPERWCKILPRCYPLRYRGSHNRRENKGVTERAGAAMHHRRWPGQVDVRAARGLHPCPHEGLHKEHCFPTSPADANRWEARSRGGHRQ